MQILRHALVYVVILSGPMALAGSHGALGFETAQNDGPRRLEVSVDGAEYFSSPSLESIKLADPKKGTVFVNDGCEAFDGVTWCKVALLGESGSGYILASDLQPATGPDGIVPIGVDDSKSRARRKDFDATDDVFCAQEKGQSLVKCKARAARSGGGDATIEVIFPNGFARQLYFTHGQFVRGSSTMSGVGTDMEWSLTNGTYTIRVDDQAFRISEAFLLGH